MTTDRIKKLSKVSGLDAKKIKELVEKKKEEAAGLLTDTGALYALEKEYGVVKQESAELTKIKDIKPDLQSLNMLAVIKNAQSPRKFKTEKREGQLARLLLADDSGEITAVLWDKNADMAASQEMQVGTPILIRNAYSRAGRDGGVEVHLGNLAKVIVNPDIAKKKELPEIKEELKTIKDLKADDTVSLQAKILNIFPKNEFKRSDGTNGQVASMIVADQTGKTRVVMWGDNAELADRFKEGDAIKVESGLVKSGERGSEVHVSKGRVLKSSVSIKIPGTEPKTLKIAQIDPGEQSIDLNARVVRVMPAREFTSKGGVGKLSSIIIADDTGFTRLILWNEKSDISKSINEGDIILVKNAYSKEGISGETEVHISRSGNVYINPDGVEVPKLDVLLEKHAQEKKISELQPDDKNVKVVGDINNIEDMPLLFHICNECGSRVENIGGDWLCDHCGEVKPAYAMNVSCNISDSTGDIRTLFYRGVAEQLTGMSVAEAMNEIGDAGDESAPLNDITKDILGKRVSVIGNVKYNDYFDRLELIASTVSLSTSPVVKKQKEKEKFDIEEINLDE